jgi:amino acid permease
VANFSGVPNLFGVCVYSFMCHHSLPSLVTPITKKRNINWLIASDFMLVLLFYVLVKCSINCSIDAQLFENSFEGGTWGHEKNLGGPLFLYFIAFL